jgi:hypothetical protein
MWKLKRKNRCRCEQPWISNSINAKKINLPLHLSLMVLTTLDTVFEVFTEEQDAVNSSFPDRAVRHDDILEWVQKQGKRQAPDLPECPLTTTWTNSKNGIARFHGAAARNPAMPVVADPIVLRLSRRSLLASLQQVEESVCGSFVGRQVCWRPGKCRATAHRSSSTFG